MSKLLTFAMALVMVFSFTACNNECNCPDAESSALSSPNRSGGSSEAGTDMEAMNSLMASVQGQVKELTELQKMEFPTDIEYKTLDLVDDAADVDVDAFVLGIFNSLLGAESNANLLNMEFSMSEAPVEDDLFIFSIRPNEELKTNEQLTFQMFNEQGFELVAHNQFEITSGHNYKAINVSTLKDGIYIFKLSDSSNRELVRRVRIGEEEDLG